MTLLDVFLFDIFTIDFYCAFLNQFVVGFKIEIQKINFFFYWYDYNFDFNNWTIS